MLANRKLFVDTFCEVNEFTKEFQDEKFYDLGLVDKEPGAIYLLSRQQFLKHIGLIKELAQSDTCLFILGNPAEGSETMLQQIKGLGIVDLVQQGKILIIAGGHLQDNIPFLYYENFLPKILDYEKNLKAIKDYQEQYSTVRPYKFLFLNGRARAHRRYLLEQLSPLLTQAIWTNLDNTHGHPIKLLEPQYEFDFYQRNTELNQSGFVKHALFNNDWGEIYLNPRPYLDTYFSLVTETVFDYPYSFRTEKIWKPIAIGHPFVAVANYGYYQDLHALGFKTFGYIIDESFDLIQNNHDRLARITQLVKDLCQQDLASFLNECYNVCKYNQQHLAELRIKVRKEFPQQFSQYINERS